MAQTINEQTMNEKSTQQKELNFMVESSGLAGAGKLSDILVRYSTSVVLTHILGARVFGVFVLGRTIVWVVANICQLGMGLGAVRQIAFFCANNDENKARQIVRLSIFVSGVISILVTILLFLAGDFVSLSIFKKSELVKPLKLLIFSIPFITLATILLEILRGYKKIKQRIALEYYFLPLSNLLLIFIFYISGLRLEGVIAAFVLSNFFLLVLLVLINRVHFGRRQGSRMQKEVVLHFFKFSLPLMFAKILGQLKTRLDVLFLGFLSTTANVGIFFIAFRLAAIISIPWQAANMIVAPMVSGYFARGDIKSIEYNFKNITKLMFMFGMFAWAFLLIFSNELLSVFGKEFKAGSVVVLLVCMGQVIKALVGHSGPILAMIGKSSLNLLTTVSSLISMAVLNLLLVPRFGIVGAGVANLTGVAIASLLELYFLYRFLRIHPFRMDFIKPVIAALVAGGMIYMVKTQVEGNLFAAVALMATFILFYFALLYLQKFSEEEIVLLEKIKRKVGIGRKNDNKIQVRQNEL
jgi:O-antigen/teichoic acid export membrane protein